MEQAKKYKEITNRKSTLVRYFYVGAMLLFYLSYILLENYRHHQSEKWKSINNLTLQDVQAIQQLAYWNTVLESLFIGLFLIGALFLYKKNREKLIYFIVLNICLFAFLFIMSYILSFFVQLPIGNLTQPLLIPTFILVPLMFYSSFISLKQRLGRSI
ncbi:hypothetical protein H9635_04065 [Solibacillus sp. A46]|uniref:Exosortase F system-associated protein n=1 Tax=Solibacillus faecavium TaxID=2762221 RepID=A0ABR8XVN7_9BACL|nr:hypothetical protein [Solibacillus faecavium]MBD8035904.1 hypothetical protein [Solibacillus faecavium]